MYTYFTHFTQSIAHIKGRILVITMATRPETATVVCNQSVKNINLLIHHSYMLVSMVLVVLLIIKESHRHNVLRNDVLRIRILNSMTLASAAYKPARSG